MVNNPFRILTQSYDSICVAPECQFRRELSQRSKLVRAIATIMRVASLMVSAAFVAFNWTMLAHAQPQSMQERARALEVQVQDSAARLQRIESEIQHMSAEISQMNGFGIGLGSALGAVQLIGIAVGYRRQRESS